MHLRHLRTFVAAASRLNFTRAAEEVHLAPSSVTEQIQVLEADLGTPLFDRSRRKLRLTAAGQRLLEHASEILALADEARAAVAVAAHEHRGLITIGSLETLSANWLPPLLAKFRDGYPGIKMRLKVASSGMLRSGVRSGELDVCFVFDGVSTEPDLLHVPVGRASMVVIVSSGHRLAGRATVARADLAGEPFLVTEGGCVYRQMFERAFPPGSVERPEIAGEFGSIAAIQRLVEAGMGCAFVPRLSFSEKSGRAVALPLTGAADPVLISMIWRRRRAQPPVLRLLLEQAQERGGLVRRGDARPQHAIPFP